MSCMQVVYDLKEREDSLNIEELRALRSLERLWDALSTFALAYPDPHRPDLHVLWLRHGPEDLPERCLQGLVCVLREDQGRGRS